MVAQKIAACYYCGTKAAPVLRGQGSHELSCGSCGAPLHDLKRLPVEPRAKTPKKRPTDLWHPVSQRPAKKMKPQKKPKKKRGFSFMKAAFAMIEDVFD